MAEVGRNSQSPPVVTISQTRARTRNGNNATKSSAVVCVKCSAQFPTKRKYAGHLSKCQTPKTTNGALKKPEDAIQATPPKTAKNSNGRRVTFNETLEYAFITPEKSSDDEASSHGDSFRRREANNENIESSSEDSSSDSSSSSSSEDESTVENAPSPGEVPCLQCNDAFSTISELEAHKVQAHTNQFLFECPVCHEKSEVPTEVKEITCPHCKQISEAWQPDDEPPLSESETIGDSESAAEPETILKAEEVHGADLVVGAEHVVESQPDDPAMVIEPEVLIESKPTIKPASLGAIRPADKYSGIFGCPRCERIFDSKISLRDHQIATHPAFYSGYLCRHKACNNKFQTYEDYIRHLERHQLKHTCEYCDKSFSLQTTLRQHIRVHTGERPFVCDECGRSFAVKDYLTKHTRIHTGERPYKCQHGCGAKFTQQSARKVHMLNSCRRKNQPPTKRTRSQSSRQK